LVLGAGYVGAQLVLRIAEELRPTLSGFALVTSIALLVSLVGTVAYLRADSVATAGPFLGLAESVAHLLTDVATHLLTGSGRHAFTAALPHSLLEFAIRWSALSIALAVLVGALRRVRPGNATR
jgi:hypothetical protein